MVMRMKVFPAILWLVALVAPVRAQVEVVRADGVLDPSRAVKHVQTVESFHKPLPEEYVWTADDAAVATGEKQLSQLKRDDWKVEPHDFRGAFAVKEKPRVATLVCCGAAECKGVDQRRDGCGDALSTAGITWVSQR